MTVRSVWVLVVAFSFASLLGGIACSPRSSHSTAYTPTECDFSLPSGFDDEDVDCGTVSVPESRHGLSDATIQLAVAVYKSRGSESQGDPVVYLSGGPGGAAIASSEWILADSTVRRLLNDRDVVFIDQRGTGQSSPSLKCLELDDVDFETALLPSDDPQLRAEGLAAVRACREYLAGEGVALGAYTTQENAADIPEVLRALGYREWNLYGVSYGTRLAQAVMRDHEQGLRSVILDSPAPLDTSFIADIPVSFQGALDAVVAACAADTACRDNYGDLGETLESIASSLQQEPFIATAYVDSEGEESIEVLIDAPRFLDMLHGFLYSTWAIEYLPEELREAEERGEEAFTFLASYALMAWGDMSRGMYLSVNCAEELPRLERGDHGGNTQGIVHEYLLDFRHEFADMCETWDVPAAEERLLQPLVSDIPTLVLSGAFDPVTPPAYAERVASTLTNAHLFVFGNESHGLLGSTCPTRLIRDFLNDPTTQPEPRCDPSALKLEFYEDWDVLLGDPFEGADCFAEKLPDCLAINPELASLYANPAECQGMEARVCLVPFGYVRKDVVEAILDFHRETAGIEILVLPSLPIPEKLIAFESSQVTALDIYHEMQAIYAVTDFTPSSFVGLTPIDIRPSHNEYSWMFGARYGADMLGHNHGVFSYFRMANVEPYDNRPLNDELLFERAAKYMGRYVALLHLDHPAGEDIEYLNYQDMWGFGDLDGMGTLWPEGPAACAGGGKLVCIVPDNDWDDPAFATDLDWAVARIARDLDLTVEVRTHAGSYYPTLPSWSEEFRDDILRTFIAFVQSTDVTVIGVTDDAFSQSEDVAPHIDAAWPEEQLAVVSAHGAGKPGTAEHRTRLYLLLYRAIAQAHYGMAPGDESGSLLWDGIDHPADLDDKELPVLP